LCGPRPDLPLSLLAHVSRRGISNYDADWSHFDDRAMQFSDERPRIPPETPELLMQQTLPESLYRRFGDVFAVQLKKCELPLTPEMYKSGIRKFRSE
jgi:hypothetical protein